MMGVSRRTLVERSIGLGVLVLAALGPFIFSDYWAHELLTQTFLMGIAAASLIFLSAYGGMVSLAQTALYGIAGFIVGNLVTTGEKVYGVRVLTSTLEEIYLEAVEGESS